jgi:hypothetical protein
VPQHALRGKKSAVYGTLTDANGTSSPVEVLGPVDRVGYAPDRLDGVINAFIRTAETGSAMLLQYSPMLGHMLAKMQTEFAEAMKALSPPEAVPEGETPKDFPVDRFEKIVMLSDGVARVLERIAKIMKQSSEAMDDATRLRAFVVGIEEGDDQGLAGKGENELRRMVIEAAQGWQKPVEGQ